MATLHPPLNLNTTSLQDMLDVGWIPPQDAEEIVRQRGPSGRLYLARLLQTASLYQMKLDQLIQQGIVTVHFQDDDNLEETKSLLSDTSSMGKEMEAMREKNRLLREAMGQQTRLQQDVLARFVGEMATRERSDRITVREQQDNSARRTAVTQELTWVHLREPKNHWRGIPWDSRWPWGLFPDRQIPLWLRPCSNRLPWVIQWQGRRVRMMAGMCRQGELTPGSKRGEQPM